MMCIRRGFSDNVGEPQTDRRSRLPGTKNVVKPRYFAATMSFSYKSPTQSISSGGQIFSAPARSYAMPHAEHPSTDSNDYRCRGSHGVWKPIAVDVAFFHGAIVADSLDGPRPLASGEAIACWRYATPSAAPAGTLHSRHSIMRRAVPPDSSAPLEDC